MKERGGVLFYVDDGTGPVAVDPREGLECAMATAFATTIPTSRGDVALGAFRTTLQPPNGKKKATAIEVVEKIVPITASMFVLGTLEQGCIARPIASTRGRDSLLVTTKRNAIMAFVAATGICLPGIALAAMPTAPPPIAASFSDPLPPATFVEPPLPAPVVIEPPPVPPVPTGVARHRGPPAIRVKSAKQRH